MNNLNLAKGRDRNLLSGMAEKRVPHFLKVPFSPFDITLLLRNVHLALPLV